MYVYLTRFALNLIGSQKTLYETRVFIQRFFEIDNQIQKNMKNWELFVFLTLSLD